MTETKKDDAATPETPKATPAPHERPEVVPLLEKAGALSHTIPQGVMKTGGDVVGGGAARPLADVTPIAPGAEAEAKADQE